MKYKLHILIIILLCLLFGVHCGPREHISCLEREGCPAGYFCHLSDYERPLCVKKCNGAGDCEYGEFCIKPYVLEGSACFHCSENEGVFCSVVAGNHLVQGSILNSDKEAVDLLHQMCDKQRAMACLKLWELYSKGVHVALNKEKAQHFLELSCSYGSPSSCLKVGEFILDKITNETSQAEKGELIKKSYGYMDKACALDWTGFICFSVEVSYQLDGDCKLAQEFRKRGCAKKKGPSCKVDYTCP